MDPNDIEMSSSAEFGRSPYQEDLEMVADQIFEI
jgi:hypothetical protein